MFVDSHCHLDRLSELTHGGDVAATLAAARAAHVHQFLAISTSLEALPGLAAIARAHEDVVISAGLHPLHQAPVEPSVEQIVEAAQELAIEHGLSNGLIESVNTKIRLITRVAFGFRSPEALIALAMLNLGGHRPVLPGRK